MNKEKLTKDDRLIQFSDLWKQVGGDDHLVIRNENLMDYLNNGGFFTAPASTKYHGVYDGGLFDHSIAVAKRLIQLTENNGLRWKRVESPFIVGMFHDLCKCDQYLKVQDKSDPRGFHYEYNSRMSLKGHGSKSVMILSQFINLTEEEVLCIRYHMGAYETDELEEFDRAIRMYENTLWTHHADQLACKIDGV